MSGQMLPKSLAGSRFRPVSLLPLALLLTSVLLLWGWRRWRRARQLAQPEAWPATSLSTYSGEFVVPDDPDVIPGEILPAMPDDLTLVEGIDERIALLLQANGINSFEQLALADLDNMARLLSDADIPLADPTTWPEQARLIVAGNWQALTSLQNDLQARPDTF